MIFKFYPQRAFATLFFAGMLLSFCLPISAAPLLRCFVTYAGATQEVQAHPVADPYSVPSVDIAGRFRFKAVMVGSAQKIQVINLYAYLDAKRQPILIQQAKYLPPYKNTSRPYNLTGQQYLYASEVERELQYHCTLEGIAP